jgi:(E)-4-hydroxy-3-methylbut-2-enyl-diphosphate synthase
MILKKVEFIDVRVNDDVVFNASSSRYLLQSMTNTDTNDVSATVQQIRALVVAGADLVRVTVPGLKEVEALRNICKGRKFSTLTIPNYVPLIADVHFLPEVAEQTATFMEKIRINPGNFTDNCRDAACHVSTEQYHNAFQKMAARAKPLIEICKKHNTVIRVGVNQGSLSNRIISKYGKTPGALVESALEWVKVAEMNDFHQIVFSIKSSHVKTMMEANLLLYNKMKEQGRVYPFHLGVTEAANKMEGRVKSAIGIGGLLLHGLGNTFRVSLTENPIHEIEFSKLLVAAIQALKQNDYAHISDGTLTIRYHEASVEKWWAGVGALIGKYWLHTTLIDIIVENPHFSSEEIEKLRNCALQICNIKKTYTEIIACPSCGRTQYDIQSVLNAVKQQFANYPYLKIAVMGCVVNGPGEMADADYGIIGSANKKVAVYKGKKRISNFVSIPEALEILKFQIEHSVQINH